MLVSRSLTFNLKGTTVINTQSNAPTETKPWHFFIGAIVQAIYYVTKGMAGLAPALALCFGLILFMAVTGDAGKLTVLQQSSQHIRDNLGFYELLLTCSLLHAVLGIAPGLRVRLESRLDALTK